MNNLTITGTRRTELDNNLRITSESVPGQTVLIVNSTTNRVGINNNAPTVDLDITGSTLISSTLAVQTNKLIVDSSGRVGVNVTPTTYQFQVSGNVFIDGNLEVFGTDTNILTTSLEITDPNIVLNKNGNDTSAQGAGITIDRVSTDASLIWNNSSTSFKAGLVGSETALIRDGGDTLGAAMTVGTNDSFALNLETNNTTRMSIANTGDVTVAGDLALTSGDILIQGVPMRNAGFPPGTIIQFLPGTFGNGSNGSFALASAIATNDATGVNNWLASIGFGQWKVCNGASYNVAGSPLYSGASKFTPNLTDDRFLQGSTVAGSAGGTNDKNHTHAIPNALTGIDVTHSHTIDTTTIPQTAITFCFASTPITTGPASPSLASISCTIGLAHCHEIGSHVHSGGSFTTALILCNTGTPTNFIGYEEVGSTVWTANQVFSVTCGATFLVDDSTNLGRPTDGCTGAPPLDYGPTGLSGCTFNFGHGHPSGGHTHTATHSHCNSASHTNHGTGPHTHAFSSTSWSAAAACNTQFCHSHPISTPIHANPSFNTENRPQFLACFYLVRVA